MFVTRDPDHLETVARWKGKAVGRACTTFPAPNEWRLEGIDAPLDRIEVKGLTHAISRRTWVEPSCVAAWEARIGRLPDDIGQRYNNALLTPKDWASHFKNVLHRGMRVKGHDPDDKACRCCKYAQRKRFFGAAQSSWDHQVTPFPAAQSV